MQEIIVDARGLSCPEPVVRTKKALLENAAFTVLVDNETSKENVIRFCNTMYSRIVILNIEDGWKISLSK